MKKNMLLKNGLGAIANPTNKKKNSARGNILFGAILLPFVFCSPAHSEIWTVATVTDVQFVKNTCNYWSANITFSALPYAEAQVRSWDWNHPNHSVEHSIYGGFHVHQDKNGLSYNTFAPFTSPANDIKGRLDEINQTVMGQKNPPVGATKVLLHSHNGECAADYGNRECIGIFIGNENTNHLPQGGHPTTIPAGLCWGVPIPNRYCEWGDLSLTIDHGTVHRNKESIASAKTKVTCHGATTYSVKLVKPIEDVTLLINDKPLENMFQGTISGEQDITFTSIIKPSVTGSFRRSGVLLVSPE
ncbi:hypothetical protein ACK37F_19250 [Aeromonas veronii]|uniref:Uncharacterized protein n=1 Tax=Aeromonas veronii AMC34 TaxID=1073383 RepID=K1IXP1_AERVE|nr:hypothetical protein [Aeromonas veronii]EKB22746.1 hypothetical protein HMPREF1168_00802 [Aeromonas veronii AMC34]